MWTLNSPLFPHISNSHQDSVVISLPSTLQFHFSPCLLKHYRYYFLFSLPSLWFIALLRAGLSKWRLISQTRSEIHTRHVWSFFLFSHTIFLLLLARLFLTKNNKHRYKYIFRISKAGKMLLGFFFSVSHHKNISHFLACIWTVQNSILFETLESDEIKIRSRNFSYTLTSCTNHYHQIPDNCDNSNSQLSHRRSI